MLNVVALNLISVPFTWERMTAEGGLSHTVNDSTEITALLRYGKSSTVYKRTIGDGKAAAKNEPKKRHSRYSHHQ